MFRQMLLSGAARLFAPSDDYGAADADDAPDEDLDLGPDDEGDEPIDEEADENVDLADDVDEGEDPPRRQPSRGERRFQALSERTRIAEERAAAAERSAQAALANRQSQDNGANQERRQAYLDSLAPDQRTEFLLQEQNNRTAAAFQHLEFKMEDKADKAAFDQLCASNPTAAKLKDRVESQLQAMRAAGTTASRETILKHEIGEMALKRAPQARGRAEKKAAETRARLTTRPGQPRSDVGRSASARGQTEQQARAKRLENVKI